MLFFLHILRVESWWRIENEMTLSTTTILRFIGRAFHNTFTHFCLFLYLNSTKKNLKLLATLPPPHWALPYSPILMWTDRRTLFRMDGREVQHLCIWNHLFLWFLVWKEKRRKRKTFPASEQHSHQNTHQANNSTAELFAMPSWKYHINFQHKNSHFHSFSLRSPPRRRRGKMLPSSWTNQSE